MINNVENHEKQDGRRDDAMRLFDALSSVDETLLARSEEKTKVIPFWKYAKVAVAGVCVMVLGLAAWNSVRLHPVGHDFATAGDYAALENPEIGYTNQIVADAMGEEAAEEAIEDNVLTEGCMLAEKREYFALEELREIEELGEYIPTVIPAGYVFESGYVTGTDEREDGMGLLFSQGMDDVQIFIQRYNPSHAEMAGRIVDISETETYDVRLYEIPYADSVPVEYREIFNDPIFLEKDVTRKVVEARMKSVEDAGDTDTPRGRFSVLYDSGIMVRFSGDCDVNSVWEMFQSIKGK